MSGPPVVRLDETRAHQVAARTVRVVVTRRRSLSL